MCTALFCTQIKPAGGYRSCTVSEISVSCFFRNKNEQNPNFPKQQKLGFQKCVLLTYSIEQSTS
jgi:hypothetical protein